MWVAGKAYQPWGMEFAEQRKIVLICEGESDALAINQVFGCLIPEDSSVFGNVPHAGSAELVPFAVAIPGAQSFKREWAGFFKGKIVILGLIPILPDGKPQKRFGKLLRISAALLWIGLLQALTKTLVLYWLPRET